MILNPRAIARALGSGASRHNATADAQEFYQIRRFVAACRQQWPGARIVLRPDQDGAPKSAYAPPITLKPHPKETS